MTAPPINPITLTYVRRMLAKITEVGARDPETAHMWEDELHRNVLRAIANGDLRGRAAEEVAELTLSSTRIQFSRWYA